MCLLRRSSHVVVTERVRQLVDTDFRVGLDTGKILRSDKDKLAVLHFQGDVNELLDGQFTHFRVPV